MFKIKATKKPKCTAQFLRLQFYSTTTSHVHTNHKLNITPLKNKVVKIIREFSLSE